MISDEAVEAAARVFYHLQPNGTPLIREREQARAALEAALPHLLASQGCGTGHSGEQLEPDVGETAALALNTPQEALERLDVAEGLCRWACVSMIDKDRYYREVGAFWDVVGYLRQLRDGGEAVHSPAEREGSRDEPKNTLAHPQKGGEG